ncbi:MAG: hypothetical protein RIR11_144 [Bacteroidota bacterium]|jgi:hypothetical protein
MFFLKITKSPLVVAAVFQLILTLSACEKVVTDDLNVGASETRLVIEGGIERNPARPDAPQRIRLTSSLPYLSKEQPPAVENALMQVSDGTQTWTFEHRGEGWYEVAGIEPKVGKTYTLDIAWGGDNYQGRSQIEAVPPIDSLYYAYEAATSITNEGYFVRLDIQDPADVANFYYFRVLINGMVFVVPDRGNNRTLILSDAFFDGQKSTRVNPNEEVRIEIGDTVAVQQMGITKGYFDYLYSLFTQTGNQGLSVVGNPPPAPIRSNIINLNNPTRYPLGYFYTSDVSEKSVIIQ